MNRGVDITRALFGRMTVKAGLSLLVLVLGVSLLMTITGPFDTYRMGGFSARMIYWFVLVAVSLVVVVFAFRGAAPLEKSSKFLMEIGRGVIFLVIFTPLLVAWTWFMLPHGEAPAISWLAMAGYNAGIWASIASIRIGWTNYVESTAYLYPPRPRLAQRLPDDFDGDILRLSADGHYVNVVTTDGTYELRMRLADAVGEVDGLDGSLVHRSHWVARHAIDKALEHKGRFFLRLKNDDEIPVGPKYRPELERAGLI